MSDIITVPTTEEERAVSTAYNYCVDNCCINSFADRASKLFENFHSCDAKYFSDIELAVLNLSQEMANVCGTSLACLVGRLCGDSKDVYSALTNEAAIKAGQGNMNRTQLIP